MDREHPVTAACTLRILRRHRGVAEWVALHGSEIPPGAHTPKAMLRHFRAQLDARGERGVLNLLRNFALLPHNPFEPERRRLPRPEIVAIGSLALLLAGAVVWFNKS
jgi:hypothetical protein